VDSGARAGQLAAMQQDASSPDIAEPAESFAEVLGYHIERWEDGLAILEAEVQRHHLNRNLMLHGGVLVSLIDSACGFSGLWAARPGFIRRGLTLSLTTQFIGPARLGQTLRVEARKTGGGRSLFFSAATVTCGERLVGRGEGVFRYRRGSETPEGGDPVHAAP